MDKTLVAASGNKHDYYSFPPYWWPNPDTKDGLPYIRKDGQTNPDANSDATDKNRLVKMSNDVSTLALAWYFSHDDRYAQKAAEQLKTWFLDPKTRMTPNLQHAQAIPASIPDAVSALLIAARWLTSLTPSPCCNPPMR
ncbi:Alginate lyase [Klebsiella michiganensis]|uniref:Alginate lyase n=1 Tax=Klebsiella michiganensis TaxID=1134687 RepID=A0A7H4MWM1_9ENTR|nr:Alginate lyase [Klebsiella michiganensis]